MAKTVHSIPNIRMTECIPRRKVTRLWRNIYKEYSKNFYNTQTENMKKTFIIASFAALSLTVAAQNPGNVKFVQVAQDYSQLSTPTLLNSFIKKANSAEYTAENRVIMLRNAMDLAQTDKQRKQILKEVAGTGAFQGLVFAAEWLDNAAVKVEAAKAVLKIALANKDYAGTGTRQAITKAGLILGKSKQVNQYLNSVSGNGLVKVFNGKNLDGWKGLVENPIARAKMTPVEEAQKQIGADEIMRRDWNVIDGQIVYVGHGFENLCTVKKYGDFEMYVDWKLDPKGAEPDAGIYLRGTPQVQIWDTARVNVGAQVGSGGLYNNQKNESKPSQVADNKLGEWNSFHIIMRGEKVTVFLNGVKVVDNVTLENYWDRNRKIFPVEQIELQAHGSRTYFRDIYIKEL
ncbi:MAG: DUF1080 domain-containing protein [Bacteroidaceae bacterium]|nr:DUF1080 domain-containing protein [Bacteroidaceae bacterium]